MEGELPAELNGRYLRNGPNPFGETDPGSYHWFTGAGMVHGIRLGGGRAEWYRNRYVGSKQLSEFRGTPDIPGWQPWPTPSMLVLKDSLLERSTGASLALSDKAEVSGCRIQDTRSLWGQYGDGIWARDSKAGPTELTIQNTQVLNSAMMPEYTRIWKRSARPIAIQGISMPSARNPVKLSWWRGFSSMFRVSNNPWRRDSSHGGDSRSAKIMISSWAAVSSMYAVELKRMTR